ncbi:MAG TPA: hypothetical protein DEB24_07875 [Coriobacteriia bacterium]|nr:hypothetical protein [Coriobacteriia bacterium]
MNKRLYKSDDPVIAGICGGLAEYLDLDPTLVRILYVIICFVGLGFPVILYLIIMFIMPKKPMGYYIDVPGSASQAGSSTGPLPGLSACSSPGSAYTTANPEAFDVTTANPEAENKGIGAGVQVGLVFGVAFIGIGLFALLKTVFGVSLWHFWPMILVAIGLVVLLTPNRKGWSLSRAGNAIFLITLAVVLQFWNFGFLTLTTLLHVIFMMWPVLLVLIGLGILTAVTGKNIFSLLGSLLVSAALIAGVWFFGDVPGFSLDLDLPLIEQRTLRFNMPASPNSTIGE